MGIVGSTNYEPVMFDIDPLGGKKVPCTKDPESGITACSLYSRIDALRIAELIVEPNT